MQDEGSPGEIHLRYPLMRMRSSCRSGQPIQYSSLETVDLAWSAIFQTPNGSETAVEVHRDGCVRAATGTRQRTDDDVRTRWQARELTRQPVPDHPSHSVSGDRVSDRATDNESNPGLTDHFRYRWFRRLRRSRHIHHQATSLDAPTMASCAGEISRMSHPMLAGQHVALGANASAALGAPSIHDRATRTSPHP